MQATVIQLIAAAAILGCLAGCRRTPELRPRLVMQGEDVSNGLGAPYIAVVKIVRMDLQGSQEPIFQGGSEMLQLVKYVAIVENTIKGDLPNKTINFFFFATVDKPYLLDPGKRYIVSLRSEGGVLRTWADGWQPRVQVHSGSHSQRDLPLDLGPSTTIAYILLTPGTDCDLHEFRQNLDWPRYASDDPGYINQRLKQLQLHPDRALRDSACVASAALFWHRPKCLEQALDSPDSRTRQAAGGVLKDDSVHSLKLLRNDPFSLFPGPSIGYMLQMFEIYTDDMRPEVRKAACAALRKFAPQHSVRACR